MDRWLLRFRSALEEHGLLAGIDSLLLAVSGGADSVALLRLFVGLRERAPVPRLLVGHVHHGLRGAEADADARFVRDLAATWGVPFLIGEGDAGEIARRRGLSPEAAARELRYDTFRAWADAHGLDGIALAHQRDDQAETVLLAAVRGGGPRAACGMPRRRVLAADGRVQLIRPLLDWWREDLLAFLRDVQQEFREDATNQDVRIPRNRLRREILPALESMQPGARLSLVRLGERLSAWEADLTALGERALAGALREESPVTIELDIEALRAWPPSVRREALRGAAVNMLRRGGLRPVVPGSAIDTVLHWLRPEASGVAAMELASRLRFESRYGRLRISLAPEQRVSTADPVALALDGWARWGAWEVSVERVATIDPAAAAESPLEEVVDADRVAAAGPLGVRARRPGDRLRPLGTSRRVKLKEFLRQERIAPSERDGVPLVTAGDAIVWVVGCRIDETFRLHPRSRAALRLRARRT